MSSNNKHTLPNDVGIERQDFIVGATVTLTSWSGEPFECELDSDSYIMFNRDGSIYDIAGNIETAINFTDAIDGIAGYAVSRDIELQARLDREYALQRDLYGI